MANTTVNNNEDLIDIRDVIKRIEELKDTIADELERTEAIPYDEQQELEILENFARHFEAHSTDYQYGGVAIRDTYFEEYAKELAEDIGVINKDATWPIIYIDWERAAEDLKLDYIAIEFDGVRYWVR